MIDPLELEFEYYKSPGPGGQNVNKVSTAVRLRFNVRGSISLAEDVKERLMLLAANRVTGDGILIIEAHRHRTREQNQQDAVARLEALAESALRPPKMRRATRPTRSSVKKRLDAKRRRSQVKRGRAGEE